MASANPVYIPRNHQVEKVIQAGLTGDYAPFEALLAVLENPYTPNADFAEFERPPEPEEVVHQTFCGT